MLRVAALLLSARKAAFALFACVLTAITAEASLIDLGATTYDTSTQLEWLDLSFTQGLSYTAVLNGAGNFTTGQGFRFATAAEVQQLFLNAGAVSLGFPSQPPISVNVPAAQLLLSLLGTTLTMPDINRSWMFYDPASDPGLPTAAHVPTAVFGEGFIGGGYPNREGFFLTPGLYPGRDNSSPEWASALVRQVPEPATWGLCGFGAVLLAMARHRARSSKA